VDPSLGLLSPCGVVSRVPILVSKACSLLLGHPWEFDTVVVHHGRSNKYTLVDKGKKITLLPLMPNEIV
jgi:hypothetical protein